MPITTYLITGANRGIGHGIAEILLSRPDTRVIVTVRPQPGGLDSLNHAAVYESIVVDLGSDDATSESGCASAFAAFRARNRELKIDVVIAAAGMVNAMETVDTEKIEDVLEQFNVNCVGVLRLWQGLIGSMAPNVKFIPLTSSVGSITDIFPYPSLAYGISKAGLNYLVRKIHIEHKDAIVVAVHPGWVQTNMGNFAADAWKTITDGEQPNLTVAESASKTLELIDGLT